MWLLQMEEENASVLTNILARIVSFPTLACRILAGMEAFASQISVTTKWTMSAVVHWVT